MKIVRKAAALLLMLAAAACDESPVSLPEPASVAVSGGTMALLVGDAAPVAAQVLDEDGRVMQGLSPVFSTDNPAVATVGNDGMVRGVGPGTANVSATYGGNSAVVKVTVTAGSVTVSVPGTVMALAVGDAAPMAAQVLDRNGRVMPGAPLVFSTDNPGVATVGNDGVVHGVGAGTANVTASYGGSSAVVKVTVTAGSMTVSVPGTTMALAVGDVAPMAAQVLDRNGRVMQGAHLVFSTDNPTVATVGADGTLRGVSPGTANVTASYGGASATVKVTVTADRRGDLQSLDVLVDSVVADRRAGVQAVAIRALNGFGQPVCPQLTLRTTDPSVATARNAGACRIEIVPGIAGETTIIAEAEGRADSVRVRVTSSGAIAFFSARPTSAQLVAGATVSYTVKVLDQTNRPVAGRTVNFEVGVGSLSANTVVTDSSGTATVQWTIPTDLRDWGQTQWIGFRTTLPNGRVAGTDETVFINGASLAEIRVYTSQSGSPYMLATADSVIVPTYVTVYLGVNALDQYGNARVVDWNFSATSTGQYWSWSWCGGPSGSPFSSGGEYTCFYSYPGTLTVRARAESGETRSIRFIFR